MKKAVRAPLTGFLAGSLLLHAAVLLVFAPEALRENPSGWSLATQLLPPSSASPASTRVRHNEESGHTEVLSRFEHTGTGIKTSPEVLSDSSGDPDNATTTTGHVDLAADNAQPRSASPEMEITGQEIRHLLVTAMLPFFDYPVLARRQGWQGEVQLAVHVARDGHLTALRLARSSGYPILDAAALASLGKVRRLPDAATRQFDHRGFDLRVPVVYRLTEG